MYKARIKYFVFFLCFISYLVVIFFKEKNSSIKRNEYFDDGRVGIVTIGKFPYKSLDLVGNYGNDLFVRYCYSEESKTYENDMFLLSIMPEIVYDANIVKRIQDYIAQTEIDTGLKMKFGEVGRKLHIVVSDEASNSAWHNTMELYAIEMLDTVRSERVIRHELVHVVEGFNANKYHPFISEGFAQVFAMKNTLAKDNESHYDPGELSVDKLLIDSFFELIMNNNLEEMLRDENLSNYDNVPLVYVGGLLFAEYLLETYGNRIYQQIVCKNELTGNFDEYVDNIKLVTSDNVFLGFEKWVFEKRKQLEPNNNKTIETIVYDGLYHRQPSLMWYDSIPNQEILFEIENELIIDLRDTYAIAEFFNMNIDCINVSLSDLSRGEGFKIAVYNRDGLLTSTVYSRDTSANCYEEAVIIIVKGKGTGLLKITYSLN